MDRVGKRTWLAGASSRTLIHRPNYPRLADGDFKYTSDADVEYNCFAWAAGVQDVVWGPVDYPPYYWPDGAPFAWDLDAYSAAFATLGYSECEHGELESGVEKIALYAHKNGEPLHATRQLADGMWTSKIGKSEDIQHVSAYSLEGPKYGTVVRILRRGRPPQSGV